VPNDIGIGGKVRVRGELLRVHGRYASYVPASASTTSATNAENIAEQIFRYMPMRLPSLNDRYPAVQVLGSNYQSRRIKVIDSIHSKSDAASSPSRCTLKV
jgi:hypothetical protein